MKTIVRRYLVLILAFLLASSYAFAGMTVSSRIKRVVLFSDQALVTREAVAELNKGLNDLFLELEAFSVDKDSVSAKVFGEGEIFSVQFKEIYLREPAQENIRALEQRIQRSDFPGMQGACG